MSATTVYTNYPVRSWDSGVAGAGIIYITGTTFDNSLLAAVEAAATADAVMLSIGTPPTLPDTEYLTEAIADARYAPIGTTSSISVQSAATWTSTNPTLLADVAGMEADTGNVKVGDGSTAWNSLPYVINESGLWTAPTPGDVVTSSGTLLVNTHHYCNATSGNLTMTLPTGKPKGSIIVVEKSDSTVNTVTATGSIRGIGSSSLTLQIQNESVLFEADTSGSWWPIAGHKTLSSLDARYPQIANALNEFSGTANPATFSVGVVGQWLARYNLTLGTAALQNSSAFDVAGAAAAAAAQVSTPALVYAKGIVTDAGYTDNTTQILAAVVKALASGASGAEVMLPSGVIGCNITPAALQAAGISTNITLSGLGNGNPTSAAGGTELVGVWGQSGSQVAPVQVGNGWQLQFLTIDGGGSGSSNPVCQSALVVGNSTYAGNDFTGLDCTFTNGTQVTVNQAATANRNHWLLCRVSNNATNYTLATRTATITGTTTFTITDGSSITTANIGDIISGSGIPLGTVISGITTPGVNGVFTVDQACTNAAGVSVTEYQGANCWLLGTDNIALMTRFNFGTKRLGGSGGQAVGCHFTFNTPAGSTGVSGLSNVLLEGGWLMDGVYFDSSPASGGASLVHKVGAGYSEIMPCEFFQNSTANNPMFVENDTTQSIRLRGMVVGGGASKAFTWLVTLAGGNCPSLEYDFAAKTATVQTTSSVPNVITGGLAGSGRVNYNGTVYATPVPAQPAIVAVSSNAGTVPVTNPVANFTNSSAAAMTITMATAGAVDGQITTVRIYDATGVAKGITWVNTEDSTATAPTTSNGSTTLPKTATFQFNGATSKWRTIAADMLTLDATATDIKPTAVTASAGSNTKAAAADHVHPNHNWGPVDPGLLGWAFDPAACSGGTALTPAGTVWLVRMHAPVAISVTNIIVNVTTQGNTLTSGQCFAGLYQGGTLLGATGDQSTAWGTSGMKTMALSGGPIAVAAGDYFVAFFYNGTTGPTFARGSTNAVINANQTGSSSRFATADTGRTTTFAGTLGAMSAAAVAYWAGVS